MKEINQLLKDPDKEPSDEVLKTVLSETAFEIVKEITDNISTEFELNPEWRYYKDGKAWLCKVVYKKKTVFWMSIWENLIKAGFYFTEETAIGISELSISENLKHDFYNAKKIGKLMPLILDIDDKRQLKDLKEVIKYKKSLK